MQKQPTAMPELLREASGLTKDELMGLLADARKLNAKRKSDSDHGDRK